MTVCLLRCPKVTSFTPTFKLKEKSYQSYSCSCCTVTLTICRVNQQKAAWRLMLRMRQSVHGMQALVCWHHLYLFVAQHCSRTSHHSLSLPYPDPCLQVSDKGGGVPFRRIENLFSYMYSTAPAPQIGEHTRTPLVSRATGGGVQGTAFIHSYIY